MLGVGAGVEYHADSTRWGFDIMVQHGGPERFTSLMLLWNVGRLLDRGDETL
ncbi:hypothetical protein Hoch_4533 [Haliangium ochraceum DSM 14365]|uniref:Uncharacterized protein n=1 Tax=Haliangium ochraceum (strain DSM 14365 / JCM 11303 / SMP-2) TaxID=502025 RepID=D0LPY9_HALO1|nr:hypothetical protein Hoch_4533 [Haliangium ochraceum DSM 14365]